ncbi:MAG: purine-nucleoside phosphorylase [Anaerotardibacter sp.]
MEVKLREYIQEASVVLKEFLGCSQPACLLILGSGLNAYAELLEDASYLDFGQVPHLHVSSAEGHKGRFVLGRVPETKTTVLVMQGRIHGYEGCEPWQVAFPVWVANALGIELLFTTNAVGAINPSFKVGSFCVMTDQINMTGRNPIVGMEPHYMAQRFVPMMDAFDKDLRTQLLNCAKQLDMEIFSGVYLGVLGPTFETPAEIRMFATWGADTVAMSVCEEVIAARHVGMKVVGMSLISNMACGIQGGDPTSEEVNEVGVQSEKKFERLMNAFFKTLD